MKNLSGKTLIFYTFQVTIPRVQDAHPIKQVQYNATTFKKSAPSQVLIFKTKIKIRDVLFELPLDFDNNSYHFRFKSEFFEGEDKVIGWIDISNLLAKVPVINNAIFVKILKINNHMHNKLFSKEKLKAVGLLDPGADIRPQNNQSQKQNNGKQKNPVQLFDLDVKTAHNPVKENNGKNLLEGTEAKSEDGNLFSFSPQKKAFRPETPEEMHAAFIKECQQKEKDQDNERMAARQLDQKINEWGYSGHKTINNLTTLLATLHTIWPQWPAVSLSDMLRPEDVQIKLKKAVIKVHPDKNRRKDFKTKYLAKRVFELLNDAKVAQQEMTQ